MEMNAIFVALKFLFPPDIQDIEPAKKALEHKSHVMGKLTFQEKGIGRDRREE